MDDLNELETPEAYAIASAADTAAGVSTGNPDQVDQVAVAVPDPTHEAMGVVELVAAMVCGYAPKATAIWTDTAKMRTAQALAPVMQKYGVSMGAFPCELTLVIVAGPVLWQSAKVMAEQAKTDKAEREKADNERQRNESAQVQAEAA